MKSGDVMAMISLAMVKQQQQQQKVMADFVVENLKTMSDTGNLTAENVGKNVNVKT